MYNKIYCEVLILLDNFEAKKVELQRFSFTFKGNFHNDVIHWLHPHPKQVAGVNHLKWIEREIRRLLGEDEEPEEVDAMEINPFLENQSHEAYQFEVSIDDEEFKGVFHRGNLEWFRPKPRRKLKDEKVEKIEEEIYEKIMERRNK